MSQWKFQFLPNEKGVIGVGYRMDEVGKEVENRINDALSYPFKFHGVNKIVVGLGPSPVQTRDYIELEGVAKKQYPDFSASDYNMQTEEERRQQLYSIAREVFGWIALNFDDASFVHKAAAKLDWELPN